MCINSGLELSRDKLQSVKSINIHQLQNDGDLRRHVLRKLLKIALWYRDWWMSKNPSFPRSLERSCWETRVRLAEHCSWRNLKAVRRPDETFLPRIRFIKSIKSGTFETLKTFLDSVPQGSRVTVRFYGSREFLWVLQASYQEGFAASALIPCSTLSESEFNKKQTRGKGTATVSRQTFYTNDFFAVKQMVVQKKKICRRLNRASSPQCVSRQRKVN